MFSLTLDAGKIMRDAEKVQRTITTTIKDVEIPRYFQQLQRIAAEATELGRIQIKLATTETGRRRVEKHGGSPGRIDTGAFYSKLKWEAEKIGKGEYRVRIGWLDGEPEWAEYQEFGFQHRSGMYVTGADALGAAKRHFENELAKLRKR